MNTDSWMRRIIVVLVFEKIIQHIVVTVALYTDWQQIGATVVVSPTLLMVAGGFIALFFMLAFWAMLTQRRWAIDLVMALALVDIVGEFYAQGRLGILITLSFIVAVTLLVLALVHRRAWIRATEQHAH